MLQRSPQSCFMSRGPTKLLACDGGVTPCNNPAFLAFQMAVASLGKHLHGLA